MTILNSIRKTIRYSKQYGGQLTKEQLFERLIGNKVYLREEIDKLIEQTLRPAGTSLDREAFKKIEKAKELAKLIEKKFKDILFLGITGSVAAGCPKKDSDIDLIIITKINNLWAVRLKLRLFVTANKIPHRRFGQREKKDDFCFNLWLDEKSLEIKKEKQNLKNAVDLILIKPLINKNKTYERLIMANNWAKKYVATGYASKMSDVRCQMSDDKILDRMVNWLVFWPQFWYMKKRIKNEKIGLHEAFFHH